MIKCLFSFLIIILTVYAPIELTRILLIFHNTNLMPLYYKFNYIGFNNPFPEILFVWTCYLSAIWVCVWLIWERDFK